MKPPKNDETASETRDFERWRKAIELVHLLRETGFDCELPILRTRNWNPPLCRYRYGTGRGRWLSDREWSRWTQS